ncbi:HpaII family restriction endonuclease [Olivibacter sp. XZL3]|uniref:HpaII family restriction endonuclease n=1 Tax=Olivibacter sp. XZL3 TaxID=1735116 RepID=UPI0010666CE6|nr:HpaII family restriction endonuclease [Olivibacter sp. XZL3]
MMTTGNTIPFYEPLKRMTTQADRNNLNAVCLLEINAPYFLRFGDYNELLSLNLQLLDSCLHTMYLEALKISQQHKRYCLKEVAEQLAKRNPLNYEPHLVPKIYEDRVKRLLTASLLGMNNEDVWDGRNCMQIGEYISAHLPNGTCIIEPYNWHNAIDLLLDYSFLR